MPERPELDQIYRPADELVQREEIGGTSAYGTELPGAPVLVQAAGIVIARPAPPMRRTSFAMTLAAGNLVSVVGPTPQRRQLLISTTEDIRIGDEQAAVSATTGYLLTPGAPLPVIDTGAVWAYCLTNDTVLSVWHAMDVG